VSRFEWLHAKPAFFYCFGLPSAPSTFVGLSLDEAEKANPPEGFLISENAVVIMVGRHMQNSFIQLAISGQSGVNEMTEIVVITTING
jgi:hypothetical protein